MTHNRIIILSYSNFEDEFLDSLIINVNRQFRLPVEMESRSLDINEFYDPERRQYNGNNLLFEIDSTRIDENDKKIGLFKVDLFIPILTYIFGQAKLGGNSGIASLYRLRNELYGIKKDDKILAERFKKVIIHEIGHMFGLIHCHNPSCVMRSSTYVEDIDQKDLKLCSKCSSEISVEELFLDP